MNCSQCGQETGSGSFCQSCGVSVANNRVRTDYSVPKSTYQTTTSQKPSGTLPLVMGLVSVVAWLIPLFGLPVCIIGIVTGAMAKSKGATGKATAGLVLSIVTLILCIINMIVGAYKAVTLLS